MGPRRSLVPILVLAAALSPRAPGLAAGERVRTLLTVDGSHGWAEKEKGFDSLVAGSGEFDVAKSADLGRWLPASLKEFGLVVIHAGGPMEVRFADLRVKKLER